MKNLNSEKQILIEKNKLNKTDINRKDDRLGKNQHRAKINIILNVMKTMDLSSPKLYKKEQKIIWNKKERKFVKEKD